MLTSKNVLCLGGMDPCGGAGLLADIKTLHQLGVQGFGVTTAITFQNDQSFDGLHWLNEMEIMRQINSLLGRPYPIDAIKVGIISSWLLLADVLKTVLTQFPEIPVIWDPVLRASAGFIFHQNQKTEVLQEVLKMVTVWTPNQPEASALAKLLGLQHLSEYPDLNIVIKGGHDSGTTSADLLYRPGQEPVIFEMNRLSNHSIHGSGCVFASALAGGLAKGEDLESATWQAKQYVYNLMQTTNSSLANHHLINND